MVPLFVAVSVAMALAWVPAATQFAKHWQRTRRRVYLGLLGVVLWFIYHNTLFAVDLLDRRGIGAAVQQVAQLIVLANLHFALRQDVRPKSKKITNGVNHG